MRGDDIPKEARRNTLRTYDDLQHKFDVFLRGETESSLLIVARCGIGKSHYIKRHAHKEITHIMEGNLRPLKTYMELYQHRHKLIVLDDAETLWADKPGRIILRALSELSFPKTLSWTSTVKPLERSSVPTSFTTNSRTCIICNSFRFGGTDEATAIIDRCQCYYFDPTNEEVARYVSTWFWDQTVLDFALENLQSIDKLTARMFTKASERRLQEDPLWTNEFPSLRGPETIVQEICNDERFRDSGSRLDEFFRRTASLAAQKGMPMSRATYMRIQADLKDKGQLSMIPPALQLIAQGSRPSVPVGVDAILADVEAAQSENLESPEDHDETFD